MVKPGRAIGREASATRQAYIDCDHNVLVNPKAAN
jgi:hypothetical protein